MKRKATATTLVALIMLALIALFDVAAQIDHSWAQGKNDYSDQEAFLLGLAAVSVFICATIALLRVRKPDGKDV